MSDVFHSLSMIMNVDQDEIAKIVHDYINRGIVSDYDRLNCPKPPIYIGPVKVETLKERLDNYKKHKHIKEDNEMKATSVQNIKNVKDICFSIENHPAEMESKLTIVASTNDDIFAFEFEGPDLLQNCKKAGLFTGWEKDKIRELLNDWKREATNCLILRDEAQKEAYKLKKENEKLKDKLENVEPFRALERTIKEKQQLKEEYEENLDVLQRKYDLERAANEAHHRFFHQYAGKGTEIEFNYAIDDTKEVSYVIVDKEEYQTLKNCDCKVRLHGMDFTRDELVNRILELEKLKTPTIENFADEEPSSRRDILRYAEKCVCGHREQDYGSPESNFQLIADLWNQYLFKEPGAKEVFGIGPMDVAMLMALMKIARIRNGGGSGDSFVDLAGYAACGGEIWAGNKKS